MRWDHKILLLLLRSW